MFTKSNQPKFTDHWTWGRSYDEATKTWYYPTKPPKPTQKELMDGIMYMFGIVGIIVTLVWISTW